MIYVSAEELRIIIPALFKVEAKLCSVALLGSTPRVREKSLEWIPRSAFLVSGVKGLKNGEVGKDSGAYLLAMSMLILGHEDPQSFDWGLVLILVLSEFESV